MSTLKNYVTQHGGKCVRERVQYSGVWKDKSKITDGTLCRRVRERVRKRALDEHVTTKMKLRRSAVTGRRYTDTQVARLIKEAQPLDISLLRAHFKCT